MVARRCAWEARAEVDLAIDDEFGRWAGFHGTEAFALADFFEEGEGAGVGGGKPAGAGIQVVTIEEVLGVGAAAHIRIGFEHGYAMAGLVEPESGSQARSARSNDRDSH